MKWIYKPEFDKKGVLQKATGQYTYGGCLFPFRVTHPPNGKYPYEIHIRLLSPATGKTLQVEGEQRRKKKKTFTTNETKAFEAGKQVEKLNASTTVYTSRRSEEGIKEGVKKGAQRLYKENYQAIDKAIKNTVNTGSLHAMAMFQSYQKEFFLTRSTKEKASTRKEKTNGLMSICAALDGKPVNELTVTDIHSVYVNLPPKKANWLIGVANSFFDYCREKAYSGPNPIATYLDHYAEKKDTESPGGEKAAKIHRIDQDKEAILQQRAREKIRAPFALAVILAKDAGLGIDEIWNLKWGDILIDGDGPERSVQIRNFQEDYNGGTQNYTRPLLPAGRQLLLLQYDQLRETHTKKALQSMYVVPDAQNPKEKANKSAITAYIRTELLHSGIRYETLSMCGIGNAKRLGGAGIVLCHEHYKHMLTEQCGIEPSSAEMMYMMGKRIVQITDDYYVSYIGADGKHRLKGYVRRDSRFAPEPAPTKPITEHKTEDGKVEKVLHAAGADKLTGCLGKIVIPPGGQLYVYSEYGLQGDIKVRTPGCDDSATEKLEY